MVSWSSSNQRNKSAAATSSAAVAETLSTNAENLKPMPVRVVMPSTRPTQAHAAPMPSADLAPISKPCTKARGVMARPVMPRPHGPSSLGIQEQLMVSTMPQNAARKGVYCNSSSVTITISGMKRCQELRRTSPMRGISLGDMPAKCSRLDARCTMYRMAM